MRRVKLFLRFSLSIRAATTVKCQCYLNLLPQLESPLAITECDETVVCGASLIKSSIIKIYGAPSDLNKDVNSSLLFVFLRDEMKFLLCSSDFNGGSVSQGYLWRFFFDSRNFSLTTGCLVASIFRQVDDTCLGQQRRHLIFIQ